MPIMQVHYSEATLDHARKAALAQRLTDVQIAMEGGANTPGGRAFAWVVFLPIRQGDWWVGGRPDDAPMAGSGRFLIRVTIPEGYMDVTRKKVVHAAVNAAVVEAMGVGHGDPAPAIQVILDEVTEGNWGAGGRTISLQAIADQVGLPKDGERFRWVRAYFDAKARQFAAAGYPAGTGGLMDGRADGSQPATRPGAASAARIGA
ncbi:MAG TPA: tautomerase family protein [Rhodopila sp.]